MGIVREHVDFDGLMNMEQSDFLMAAIIGSNDTINSSTLMEKALTQLVTTMQRITNECKKDDVALCEHATSHILSYFKNFSVLHLRLS
jgi:hypothetical protein